jgi:hypothetical protein
MYENLTWMQIIERVKDENPDLEFKEILKHASLIYRGKRQIHEKPLFLKGKAKSSALKKSQQANKLRRVKELKQVAELKGYKLNELTEILQNQIIDINRRRLKLHPYNDNEYTNRRNIDVGTDTQEDYLSSDQSDSEYSPYVEEPNSYYFAEEYKEDRSPARLGYSEPARLGYSEEEEPNHYRYVKAIDYSPESVIPELNRESVIPELNSAYDREAIYRQYRINEAVVNRGRRSQEKEAMARRIAKEKEEISIQRAKEAREKEKEAISRAISRQRAKEARESEQPKIKINKAKKAQKGKGLPSQLKPWQDHVKKVKKQYPHLTYKELLIKAKKSW